MRSRQLIEAIPWRYSLLRITPLRGDNDSKVDIVKTTI
jgi:hypothetical protein